MKKKSIIALSTGIACFCFVSVAGVYGYHKTAIYASVDVNPSIEFGVNSFNKVVEVKGVNEDGEQIIKTVGADNLKYKELEEAVAVTVKEISNEGYFDDATLDGGIVITTSSDDEEEGEELVESILESVEEVVKDEENDVTVECEAIGKKRVEEARALGVTPGKLNIVERLEKLVASSQEFDREAWLQKPVKEIMKAIKEERKSKEDTKVEKPEQEENLTIPDLEGPALEAVEENKEEICEEPLQEKVQERQRQHQQKQQEEKQKPEKTQEEKPQQNKLQVQDQAQLGNENCEVKVEKIEAKSETKVEKMQEKSVDEIEKAQEKSEAKIEKTQEKAQEKAEKDQEKNQEKTEKTEAKNETEVEKTQEKPNTNGKGQKEQNPNHEGKGKKQK